MAGVLLQLDPSGLDVEAICRVLARHEVDFIVIGGVAAVLRGAPVSTADLDVVPAGDDANLNALSLALVELGAEVRFAGKVRHLGGGEWLRAGSTWNFRTREGDFDALFLPAGSGGYAQLLRTAGDADLGDGLIIKVASIDDLIAMKEAAGRDKDQFVLPILRWLRERGRAP